MIIESQSDIDRLDYSRGNGLVTVVVQHAVTGEILMLAHANREAMTRTLGGGVLWLYSRSRDELWRKGDTSGNIMNVTALHGDCDLDAVVALVIPAGPACHTGARTCFDAKPTLVALDDTIADRLADSHAEQPAARAQGGSYTARLLRDPNLRHKKLGEEAVELALACSRGDRAGAAEEAADLLYHALVACRAADATLEDVLGVLERRSARPDRAAARLDPADQDTVQHE